MFTDPAAAARLREAAVLLFLLLLCLPDLREKKIPVLPPLLFFAAGFLFLLAVPPEEGRTAALFGTALSLLPGLFLFVLSRLTRGGIGSGDALCVLALGPFLPLTGLSSLLLCALLLSSVYAACALFKKKGKHYAYPFLPFLALAESLRLLAGLAGELYR